MAKATVDYVAASSGKKVPFQINLIPGWVEPADIRELKAIVRTMGLEPITFPDTSDVLDTPMNGTYDMFPNGGARVEDIRRAGDSVATIALGPVCSGAAARALHGKFGVKNVTIALPIGLRATDRFVVELARLNGGVVPEELRRQRGRLVDLITDMHQYFYGKTAALWGDPDQLVSLCEFMMTIDVLPRYVVTGTPGKAFLRRMGDVLGPRAHDSLVRQGPQADMFLMHQWIKNERVDLLIGNTYGKYIGRDEDIPLLRHGFPILDRVGHQYQTTVGYNGAIRILEQILAAFMDRLDRDAPEERFELTM